MLIGKEIEGGGAIAHDGGAENVRVCNTPLAVVVDEDEDEERSRGQGLVRGEGLRKTQSKRRKWRDTRSSAVMSRVSSQCRCVET